MKKASLVEALTELSVMTRSTSDASELDSPVLGSKVMS